jgi:hypothetical protein
MKKLLALIVCGVLTSTAFAETVIRIPDNLTPEQRSELQLKAAEQSHSNVSKPYDTPSEPEKSTAQGVKEWVDVGTAIGSGLASSAKELGVAANDFANTSVGKMTTLLIIWHFVGKSALHLLFAIIWSIVLIPSWVYMYRRQFFRTKTVHYPKGQREDGATKLVETDSTLHLYDTTPAMYWITLLIILIGMFVLFITL